MRPANVPSSKIVRTDTDPLDKIKMPLEGLIGYQLRRASTAMRENLRARYDALGFRVIEGSVLMMIDANPGVTQSQIGHILEIKSANMVPLIAFLEKNDHIKRKPLDGRSQGLFLTKQGQSTAKLLWECINENEKWLISRLDGIDTKTVFKVLQSIWS